MSGRRGQARAVLLLGAHLAWLSLASAANLRGGAEEPLPAPSATCPLWAVASLGQEEGHWERLGAKVLDAQGGSLEEEFAACSTFCAAERSARNPSDLGARCLLERLPTGSRCSALLANSAQDSGPAQPLDGGGESYVCEFDSTPKPEVQLVDASEDATFTGEGSGGGSVADDPYLLFALAAMAMAVLALLVSTIAIGLLCRVMGAARELQLMRARGVPVADQRAVEIAHRTASENFMSFCDADPAEFERAGFGERRSLRSSIGGGGAAAQVQEDFNGVWECTDTWGLDEFLQAMNVGKLKRLAASKAPWPVWQFTQDGNDFTWINRTKMGVITEAFKTDGSEYLNVDLEGNQRMCRAYLKDSRLVIERQGKIQGMTGKCLETRTLKPNGTLDFVLEIEGVEAKWGRSFKRKS